MPSKLHDFSTQPPVQPGVQGIEGTPEGVLYAPPGFQVINKITGKRYTKETNANLSTGWKIVTTS